MESYIISLGVSTGEPELQERIALLVTRLILWILIETSRLTRDFFNEQILRCSQCQQSSSTGTKPRWETDTHNPRTEASESPGNSDPHLVHPRKTCCFPR